MYFFFFAAEGDEPFCLPVPPAELLTKVPGKNKIIDLISTGEFNILKDVGLRDYSMKVLLPGTEYDFVCTRSDFKLPIFYLNKFRKFKTDKKPVRFIIARTLPSGEDIFGGNILVSLEDYTVKEAAGEEGDFWVEMKLKECREIAATVQEIQNVASDGSPEVVETVNRPARESAGEYAVKPGDSLWAIAKRELNDGSRYKEIAALNGIKDPNKIMPGQVLKLP